MASPAILCVPVLLQLVLIYLGTSAEAANLKPVIETTAEKPVENPIRDPTTIIPAAVALGTQRPHKPSRSDLSGLGRYGPFVSPAFWRCMENPEECGIIIEEDE